MKKWCKSVLFVSLLLLFGAMSGCGLLLDNLSSSTSSSTSSSASSSSVSGTLPDLDQTVQIVKADPSVVFAKREVLEDGDLDTAQTGYEDALVSYPTDPELNFGYSLTVFLGVMTDTNLRAFLADMGVTGIPANYADLKTSLREGTFNLLYHGVTLGGTNSFRTEDIFQKNISDYQDLFDVVLLQRMYKAIRALNIVEQDPSFSLNLNMRRLMTNAGLPDNASMKTYEIDLTEVYAYDAMLSFIAASANFFLAQNLDLDLNKSTDFFTNMIMQSDKGLSHYYNPFNDSAYPNFGNLRSDGVQRYANVKTLLLRAGHSFEKGYAYLQNETDDQSDDIIPQSDTSLNLTNAADLMRNMERSLNGEYVAMIYTNVVLWSHTSFSNDADGNEVSYSVDDCYTNIIGVSGISFGKFLDNAPSIRDTSLELDANGEPVLYDMNTNRVTTGSDGSNYFVKLNDPTYKGLLNTSSQWYIVYSVVDPVEYVLAIRYFNSAYPVWMNFFCVAPKLYLLDSWDVADNTTNGATVLTVFTNEIYAATHRIMCSDSDWFSMKLEAGENYKFLMTNLNVGGSLYSADNLDSSLMVLGRGRGSEVYYTPSQTGTYYMEMTTMNSGLFSYELSVCVDP